MIDLIFDTETTGLFDFKKDYKHPSQPHLVELGMQLYQDRELIASVSILVRAKAEVSKEALKVNQLTEKMLDDFGMPPELAMSLFLFYMHRADRLVAHNYEFDKMIVMTQLYRLGQEDAISYLNQKPYFCTKEASTPIMKLPGKYGKYKWPTLDEAYRHFVDKNGFSGAHRAIVDVEACAKVLWAMKNFQKKGGHV